MQLNDLVSLVPSHLISSHLMLTMQITLYDIVCHSWSILSNDTKFRSEFSSIMEKTKNIPKQREPLSVVLNKVSHHTISLITTAQRRHQISDSVYPTSIIFAPS